eukprot:140685-Hanusia_phi.AAC.1
MRNLYHVEHVYLATDDPQVSSSSSSFLLPLLSSTFSSSVSSCLRWLRRRARRSVSSSSRQVGKFEGSRAEKEQLDFDRSVLEGDWFLEFRAQLGLADAYVRGGEIAVLGGSVGAGERGGGESCVVGGAGNTETGRK